MNSAEVNRIWDFINAKPGMWARHYEFERPIVIDNGGVSTITRSRHYIHDAKAAGGRGRSYSGETRRGAVAEYLRAGGERPAAAKKVDRRKKSANQGLWRGNYQKQAWS